jgi:long-chain acyl-CoA synthetase
VTVRSPGADTAANVADLVRLAAADRPDADALVGGHGRTTWAQLDDRVDRLGGALRASGLGPGDRVALVLGNVVEFAITYFGALRVGCVVVPINPAYTAREMGHLLADSGARVAVVGQSALPAMLEARAAAPALSVVVTTGRVVSGTIGFAAFLEQAPDAAPSPSGSGEDLAVLLYTSGTTGAPKGAMLSHRALLADMRQVGSISPPVVTEDDVVLLVLPLTHVFGLNNGLGMVASAAATGVLVERFSPVQTLEVIKSRGVSVVLGAPPAYVAWSLIDNVGEAFSGVRLAVSGAAPLPPEVVRRLLDLTGRFVFEGYGLTEASPTVTSTLMSEVPQPGSIGRPVPGVELRLVESAVQSEDVPVDADDPGEIEIRGANLFSGYWPDGHGGPDSDGWWRTGDLAIGLIGGDLQLVDRRPELIIVSGFNVYPREVEDVLLAHPDIDEAAVLGIAHPYSGEAVKALVVRRPGTVLSVDGVLAHCARSLARFKLPTAVEFVSELPHTTVGKVARARLRESEMARLPDPNAPASGPADPDALGELAGSAES